MVYFLVVALEWSITHLILYPPKFCKPTKPYVFFFFKSPLMSMRVARAEAQDWAARWSARLRRQF